MRTAGKRLLSCAEPRVVRLAWAINVSEPNSTGDDEVLRCNCNGTYNTSVLATGGWWKGGGGQALPPAPREVGSSSARPPSWRTPRPMAPAPLALHMCLGVPSHNAHTPHAGNPAAQHAHLRRHAVDAFFNEDGMADSPYFGRDVVHVVVVREPLSRRATLGAVVG